MKEELKNKLFMDFPYFFGMHLNLPPIKRYGLSISNGWEPILRKTASSIEALIKKSEHPEKYYAVQIKEKLSLLRIYMSCYSEDIKNIIGQAQYDSQNICEFCGNFGTRVSKNGWFKICCNDCNLKMKSWRD